MVLWPRTSMNRKTSCFCTVCGMFHTSQHLSAGSLALLLPGTHTHTHTHTHKGKNANSPTIIKWSCTPGRARMPVHRQEVNNPDGRWKNLFECGLNSGLTYSEPRSLLLHQTATARMHVHTHTHTHTHTHIHVRDEASWQFSQKLLCSSPS